MFYSYDALNIRTGKLGIIWLAATGRIKFDKRRDIMATKIYKACDEIIKHIRPFALSNGVNDPSQEYPKRFSLYLSSMLMYGTVKLHNFQVCYLFDEVCQAYSNFKMRVQMVQQILDISEPEQKKATMMDPLLLGAALEFGFLDLDATFVRDEDLLQIPRKINGTHPTMKRVRESDIAREDYQVSVDLSTQREMGLLLREWDEPLSPIGQFPEDVSMLQPPEQMQRISEQIVAVEDSDFGPPFFLLPDDFLKPKDERKVEKVVEEAPPVSELPIDAEERVMLAPVTETPAEHIYNDKEIFPQQLKRKKLRVSVEETPLAPPQEPSEKLPSQIELQTIEQSYQKVPRQRRPKPLIIDEATRISLGQMRDQQNYYYDTVRDVIPSGDIIDIDWWRKIIPADRLFLRPRRAIQNLELSVLLRMNYKSSARNERYDFDSEKEGPRVRRQIMYQDDSERGESAASVSDASLAAYSTVLHDVSKTSAVEKSLPSFTETPVAPLPVAEGPQLDYVAGEVTPLEDRTSITIPTVYVTPEDWEPTTVDTRVVSAPLPRKRKFKEKDSPDYGPTLMTVVAEVHAVQDGRVAERELSEETGEREPAQTPDYGAFPVSFRAEVHRAVSVRTVIEEISSGPGPAIGRESLMPITLSPIGVVRSPKPKVERRRKLLSRFSHLQELEGTVRFALNDLLPPNPSRGDVAAIFSDLLEMHKARQVKLAQEETYGPIFISAP